MSHLFLILHQGSKRERMIYFHQLQIFECSPNRGESRTLSNVHDKALSKIVNGL